VEVDPEGDQCSAWTVEPAEEEEKKKKKQCERFLSLVVFTNVSVDTSSLKIDVEAFYETFGMNLIIQCHTRRR
jgi:hypothetical protein